MQNDHIHFLPILLSEICSFLDFSYAYINYAWFVATRHWNVYVFIMLVGGYDYDDFAIFYYSYISYASVATQQGTRKCTYTWCWSVPPRCKECRTVMKTVYKVVSRTSYRSVPACCQGYRQVNATICERKILNTYYTSPKSWRDYIFTAVCLCVYLSVCPALLVNKIPPIWMQFSLNGCLLHWLKPC